jgi:hypothetical protein
MTVVQIRGGFAGRSTTILLTTLFKVRKIAESKILISELSWLAHEVDEWSLSLWISVGPDVPQIFI